MSYSQGLNPQDIVQTSVSLSPQQAVGLTQNIPLIIGNSAVINVVERIRTFTGGNAALTQIAAQFGDTSGEYLGAQIIYERAPTLPTLKIGRWAETATPAILLGGTLTVSQQALSNFTGITTGSMAITYGTSPGTLKTLTGLNFSACTSLPQVAAVVQAALTDSATCVWDPLYARFEIATNETGTTALITFASTAGSGVDVSGLLNLRSTNGGSIVAGIAAETPVQAVTTLRALDKTWYFAHFSIVYESIWQDTTANLTGAAHVAVAEFIESCSPPSTYGIASNDVNCLSGSSTTDIAALIAAGNFTRTWVWYSSSCGAPGLAEFGKFALINYSNADVATLAMFDNLPGVVAETLTEAQATTLKGKFGNVFVNYSNQTSIVQFGTMGSGNYFDEIHATDALAATIQNDTFNYLLTQSATAKVPQTQAGLAGLQNVVAGDCGQFVTNGVLGKNLAWQGPPIGTIKTGDILPAGYYIYQPPITSQSLSARETRIAPVMTVCANLAGAVQGASVAIQVTR